MKKQWQILKRIQNTICIIMLLFLIITCKKEADEPTGNNKVELGTITIDTISYYHAYISTKIKSTRNYNISNHGFCWSTQPTPDITKDHIDLGSISSTASFSSVISNLQPDQKYFIRAFATISGGTVYGTQSEFTTLNTGVPLVTSDTVTDITLVSARSGGKVLNDGGFTVTARGICWDKDNDFDIDHCLDKTVNNSGTGHFTSDISGLSENTEYYVKAYATNQVGTSYGGARKFTTLSVTIPTVTTNEVTNQTAYSAVCGGNVTSDGNATVTARGVCWDTTGNPTLQNCINFTTDGQGTGTFTSNIAGLNASTTYYVRAYATNSEGTTYDDDDISFTTLTPWSCGATLSITHTAGAIAPVYKTVNYGTVQTNLTGSYKCWITQNLGSDRQATSATDATEASAGWYWQFNKKQGFKHDGSTRTPNTTWIPVISENSDWLSANDPCTLLLGSGWRLPSNTEWQTADNTGGWDNYNETFASVLKLHAAGYLGGSNVSLNNRGSWGFCWSSSQKDSDNGHDLYFTSGNSAIGGNSKAYCFTARCLRD